MTWVIKLDGDLECLKLQSDIILGDFDLTIENLEMSASTASGEFQSITGSAVNFENFIAARTSEWYIRISGNNYTIPFTTVKAPLSRGTLFVRRAGNQLTLNFDGDETTLTVTTAGFKIGCFGMINGTSPATNHSFGGEIGNITLNSSNLWDATSSDHSGSTAQPILTDTIGGNDATGVNFPAFDSSVWVNLGGVTPKPWWLFQENKVL